MRFFDELSNKFVKIKVHYGLLLLVSVEFRYLVLLGAVLDCDFLLPVHPITLH